LLSLVKYGNCSQKGGGGSIGHRRPVKVLLVLTRYDIISNVHGQNW